MVKIKGTKVSIKFSHPVPAEAVKDIRNAIITVLQHQKWDEFSPLKEIAESNHALLELLKHTLGSD